MIWGSFLWYVVSHLLFIYGRQPAEMHCNTSKQYLILLIGYYLQIDHFFLFQQDNIFIHIHTCFKTRTILAEIQFYIVYAMVYLLIGPQSN